MRVFSGCQCALGWSHRVCRATCMRGCLTLGGDPQQCRVGCQFVRLIWRPGLLGPVTAVRDNPGRARACRRRARRTGAHPVRHARRRAAPATGCSASGATTPCTSASPRPGPRSPGDDQERGGLRGAARRGHRRHDPRLAVGPRPSRRSRWAWRSSSR